MTGAQRPASRRLNAQIHGEAGPWLVLCHGFGTDQQTWLPMMERLQPGRRVLTFDLAYLHQPSETRHYVDIATYADDLVDLLEECGVTDADLLGHSVGAMIVLAAAVAVPERVRRLILLNASARHLDEPGYDGGMSRERLEEILEAMRTDYRDWVLGFAPIATSASAKDRGVSDFVRGLLDLGPDLARPVLRSIYELDFRPMLPAVACPTVLLQGPDDIAVTADATRYLMDHIPDVRLVPLAIEGHLPQLVAPETLAAMLSSILGETP